MYRKMKGFRFRTTRRGPSCRFDCVLESDKPFTEKRAEQAAAILEQFRGCWLNHKPRPASLSTVSELTHYCYWMLEPRFRTCQIYIASVIIKAGGEQDEYVPDPKMFNRPIQNPRGRPGRFAARPAAKRMAS